MEDLGGARRARLLPTEGRSAGPSILHQFSARRRRRACRLSHRFDSFCGGHLLFAYVCTTGVFGAIQRCFEHHFMRVYKKGERGFFSWSTVAICFQCEGFVWAREVSPHFLQGVDVYVLCVCVCAHAHTLHVGYSDVSPGVGTRHLESPEQIQMCCSDNIRIYRAVYQVHTYIYMLGYR